MEDSKRLNPDIRQTVYGKKELKEITLYPLSIGDQFKVTELATGIIQKLAEVGQNVTDLAFMAAVMSSLEENFGTILSLITDIPKKEINIVVNNLTNSQLIDIIESVWTVDYEPALKKGKNLFDRGKSVFNLKRSLASSSDSIPSTDSNTSIDEVTQTEG